MFPLPDTLYLDNFIFFKGTNAMIGCDLMRHPDPLKDQQLTHKCTDLLFFGGGATIFPLLFISDDAAMKKIN